MAKIINLSGGILLGALTGCSTLPTAGPTKSQVVDQASEARAQFDLIEIDNRVADAVAAKPIESLRVKFAQYGKPASPKIGIGDSVAISIWQTATNGLIGAAPGGIGPGGATTPTNSGNAPSFVLPEQAVAPDGSISVPYAGRVRAVDRTPLQVQQEIERILVNRIIEPQVLVSVTKSTSNVATVSGEVVAGMRVPLSARGDRLLDVVAAAGGMKSPIYETFVDLSRNGTTLRIPMEQLVSDPAENIYVWPDDVITLERSPQTFSVFGATLNDTQLPFGANHINLAQALAKAGGLQDARADPAGVFILRYESPSVIAALGAPSISTAPSGFSPVIYHLDLKNIGGYFAAKRFSIENDDIIYVANAASDDVQKFFTLVSTLTGPVIGGVVVSRGTGH